MKHGLNGLLLAFQFLTTVPITRQIPWTARSARWSIVCYPLTGLVLGGLLVSLYLLLSPFLSPLVLAALLVTLSIFYSGGLHLDGWMDVSDAFLSRRDRETKLIILKDSRVGAFAVMTTILLIGWKVLLLMELIALAPRELTWLLLLVPVCLRWMIIVQLIYGKAASDQGMAASLLPYVTTHVKNASRVWFLFIAGACFLLLQNVILTLCFLLMIWLFPLFWLRVCKREIGGMSGDTIGASIEGGELFLWGIMWTFFLSVTA
ncbi:adenosylcobinamide-GDP ribazoletransferase [Halalkalibacterium halodurans]|uniref:adenosylcobinamide-GDP ribazoletransferase n=1 Tax=Halalkalibacterium halodurans TaxID=86665 RepID=UPI002AA97A27|nr:adenosylcobinamide-GDP ribazoletransferase [Halalkalibacterium halodurans]MDY7222164.1 adenosylcobinamide-GDP ribazoletransferase [Halalkalibacterium halodurans]MDY7241385.1 adenosylcobinamide-GDP ribazoletransferase [Halalkalibacterium halodurans]